MADAPPPLTRAAALLDRHAEAWQGATRHPFLDGVRDGSLPEAAFQTWLEQDYRFVADLLGFQARLLARAPRADQRLLLDGLGALEAELGWFESLARTRGLRLDAEHLPAAARYRDFLLTLGASAGYAAPLTALWTLERAYLEAWQGAAPGAPAFADLVEHWTVPAFAAYVAGLEQAVDVAFAAATDAERAEAETAFLATTALEQDFWGMAWGQEPAP